VKQWLKFKGKVRYLI